MELHERLQQAGAPIEARPDAARDPFADVKNRIHLALVSELGPRLFDVSDGDAARERVEAEIRTQLLQEPGLSREDRMRLASEIADDIFGYGPLEQLLPDSTISEIMVNGPDEIWIERRGLLSRTGYHFADESPLRRIINLRGPATGFESRRDSATIVRRGVDELLNRRGSGFTLQ